MGRLRPQQTDRLRRVVRWPRRNDQGLKCSAGLEFDPIRFGFASIFPELHVPSLMDFGIMCERCFYKRYILPGRSINNNMHPLFSHPNLSVQQP